MCPKKSKVKDFGHIKGDYVPVKEESEGVGSHKKGLCDRKRGK